MKNANWPLIVVILAIGLVFIWMFHIETTHHGDGSTTVRNRITGHIEICNQRQECKTAAEWINSRKKKNSATKLAPPSKAYSENLPPDDESISLLAEEIVNARLNKERQEKSDRIRLKKNQIERTLDIFYSLCAGFVQLFTSLWEMLFGSNSYPYNHGIRDLWGLPNSIDQYVNELGRQSVLNARAANGGFLAALMLSLFALLHSFKTLTDRMRSKIHGNQSS